MEMLLQDHLAQNWPMLAGLSPTQEWQLGSLLVSMLSSIWVFGVAHFATTYMTVVQHLDQNLAPTVFVGFFLVALSVVLMAIENRRPGLHAASAKVSKQFDLRFNSLASACMVAGLLLLLMAFIRLA